jgi:peroxin-2
MIFQEFLLFLLPLINTRAIGRRLTQLSSQLTIASIVSNPVKRMCGISTTTEDTQSSGAQRGKYWSLPLNQCAICHQDSTMNLSDPAAALSSLTMPIYSSDIGPAPDVTEGSESEPPPFPINTPYITDCGHTYCYVCISSRLIRTGDDASGVGPGGTRWECLRCKAAVASAERAGVVIESMESEYGSEDTMSFEFGSEDVDFTDLSGSIGGDSEYNSSE